MTLALASQGLRCYGGAGAEDDPVDRGPSGNSTAFVVAHGLNGAAQGKAAAACPDTNPLCYVDKHAPECLLRGHVLGDAAASLR